MSYIFDAKTGWQPEDMQRAYRKYGVIVVRGILTEADVRDSRAELDQLFAQNKISGFLPNYLCKTARAFQFALKPVVFKALKDALGEPLCLHADFHVQRNMIGTAAAQENSGWHYDCGSELQLQPNGYLRHAEYAFAKVGLFLQDYDNGWGGGIRAVPGSHKKFYARGFSWVYAKLMAIHVALLKKLKSNARPLGAVNIPTKAGDLCFFDSRVHHTSSLPAPESLKKIANPNTAGFWSDIPHEFTKYVTYLDVGCGEASSKFFLNSIRRCFYEEPFRDSNGQAKKYSFRKFGMEPMYTAELAFQPSRDFDSDVLEQLSRNKVRPVEAEPEIAEFAKRKLALLAQDY